MTALDRYLGSRCTCDFITLGCGWLPGHCPHANCRNWDWRDNDGEPITAPLAQREIALIFRTSRQRIDQIEQAALARFVPRLCRALLERGDTVPASLVSDLATIFAHEHHARPKDDGPLDDEEAYTDQASFVFAAAS